MILGKMEQGVHKFLSFYVQNTLKSKHTHTQTLTTHF